MIMRSEKGFIRHLLRGLSIRVLEQEATLARESRQEVLSHSDILSTHPPTQDREMNREIELHYAERNRSGLIDRSWCGDRDSDVEQSQRTPSLHYTGYIVQTVCQLSVGRALPP